MEAQQCLLNDYCRKEIGTNYLNNDRRKKTN